MPGSCAAHAPLPASHTRPGAPENGGLTSAFDYGAVRAIEKAAGSSQHNAALFSETTAPEWQLNGSNNQPFIPVLCKAGWREAFESDPTPHPESKRSSKLTSGAGWGRGAGAEDTPRARRLCQPKTESKPGKFPIESQAKWLRAGMLGTGTWKTVFLKISLKR